MICGSIGRRVGGRGGVCSRRGGSRGRVICGWNVLIFDPGRGVFIRNELSELSNTASPLRGVDLLSGLALRFIICLRQGLSSFIAIII